MKILAVTSGKGGVGKTTLALNLARQLSLAGLRTLIVDFDVHNKGTTGLFLNRLDEGSPSVIQIVQDSSGFAEGSIEPITSEIELLELYPEGELLLLPAARPREMIQWRQFVGNTSQIVGFFRRLFRGLEKTYHLDAIVIDCYGGVDSLTVAAAGVADDTIIVNEPDVITFSGTLMLYRHLVEVYEQTDIRPHIHFVINRITAKYSYRFLKTQYGKNLATLAIDGAMIAYIPFDKLVMETFGDYPFFTELLPKSLVTRKIQLLIAKLYKKEAFADRFSFPERVARRIHRRTTEMGFADPDHILRAAVTALLWLLFPVTIVFLLMQGIGETVSFSTIKIGHIGSIFIGALMLFFIGVFEPIQLSRWLLRGANYSRQKRAKGRSVSKVLHHMKCSFDYGRAVLPLVFGVFIFAPALFLAIATYFERGWNDVSIWPKEITGFYRNGDYSGLVLHSGARVSKGSNFEGALLKRANLVGVDLRGVKLMRADLSGADLSWADLEGSDLEEAIITAETRLYGTNLARANLNRIYWQKIDLDDARLSHASIVGGNLSGSILTQAELSCANLQYANLQKAVLDHADLRDARLDGANLAGASLEGANLQGATFQGTSFRDAQLSDSRLENADLRKADLEGASLLGSSLSNADLRGNTTVSVEHLAYADAQEARIDDDQREKIHDSESRNDAVQVISDYPDFFRDLRSLF